MSQENNGLDGEETETINQRHHERNKSSLIKGSKDKKVHDDRSVFTEKSRWKHSYVNAERQLKKMHQQKIGQMVGDLDFWVTSIKSFFLSLKCH